MTTKQTPEEQPVKTPVRVKILSPVTVEGETATHAFGKNATPVLPREKADRLIKDGLAKEIF